ncbi:MAG: HEPN domain-containing protein [Candidatus Omnitrophica bacterium]|nr:HEPN domain-containing protein [Candidatus Omnitrophota bacterium]
MVSIPIIIERLKASPVKIISAVIYGSLAKGTQTADSDIDILLVSDEVDPRKNKRGKDVARIKESLSIGIPLDILLLTPAETASNFKNHNPLFLDIAVEGTILIDSDDFLQNLIEETKRYIRQRKLEKLADGWRFPVLYREPTFLSSVSNKDFAVAMLTDGERDFNIGVSLTKEGYFDKAVYHFQQAVEKAVKAILISFGEFKKTHFVGGILIERVNNIEIDAEWKERLYNAAKISSEIEPEVTWSRYPGIDRGELWIPYEEYTMDDAVEIKDKTEMAVKTAKDFINWWFKK